MQAASASPRGSGGLGIDFGTDLTTPGFIAADLLEHTGVYVGRGGGGIVRQAVYTRLPIGGRPSPPETVASKELTQGASDKDVERFDREFQIAFAASQRCAGACRVYGYTRRSGALCLIMKLYSQSLGDFLHAHHDPPPAP